MLLEGSIETSGGRSVALDLKQLDKYTLFPGQIVAMKGTNPTGRLFVPTLVYDPMPALVVSMNDDLLFKSESLTLNKMIVL